MRAALQAAGISTAGLLERSEYEQAYAALPESQRIAGTGEDGPSSGAASSSSSSSSSSSAADPAASPSGPGPVERLQTWLSGAWSRGPAAALDTLLTQLSDKQAELASGATWSRLAARLREADAATGASAAAHGAGQALRGRLLGLDEQLGVSRVIKVHGPPLLRGYQAFGRTPLGQIANFGLTTWFFLSGAFWTTLSIAFPLVFLVNLLFPDLLRDYVRNAAAEAAERYRAAGGGMGSGMGGGGMGGPDPFGQGGASGGPGGFPGGFPGGGAGPAGGGFPSRGGGGGRTSYSQGGPVVDAEFRPVDKKGEDKKGARR